MGWPDFWTHMSINLDFGKGVNCFVNHIHSWHPFVLQTISHSSVRRNSPFFHSLNQIEPPPPNSFAPLSFRNVIPSGWIKCDSELHWNAHDQTNRPSHSFWIWLHHNFFDLVCLTVCAAAFQWLPNPATRDQWPGDVWSSTTSLSDGSATNLHLSIPGGKSLTREFCTNDQGWKVLSNDQSHQLRSLGREDQKLQGKNGTQCDRVKSWISCDWNSDLLTGQQVFPSEVKKVNLGETALTFHFSYCLHSLFARCKTISQNRGSLLTPRRSSQRLPDSNPLISLSLWCLMLQTSENLRNPNRN
jgi:hypothetical protein